MATKQDRAPVMRHYEWDLTRWPTSETRIRLDATGRGIYRELLDWCYAQGEMPDDHECMARYCGATLDQFEQVWPTIKSHFRKAKHKPNSLENVHANMSRKRYFSFIVKQQENGGKIKKKSGPVSHDKSETSIGLASEIGSGGLAVAEKIPNQEEKRREEKTKEEKTGVGQRPQPPVALIEDRWGEFRKACSGTGIDGSGPDWDKARLEWFVLDFEMQIAAIHGIHERLKNSPDDPSLRSLPQYYIKDRKWQRPFRQAYNQPVQPKIKQVRM